MFSVQDLLVWLIVEMAQLCYTFKRDLKPELKKVVLSSCLAKLLLVSVHFIISEH